MNIKRANEIIKSSSTIEVLHNGELVWLKSINESTNTASVEYDQNTNLTTSDVPINELIEGRIIK